MMNDLQKIIGYEFKDAKLLKQSLTHPSTDLRDLDGNKISYERLEFLGDSALGLVIAEILINKYPFEEEGSLAKRQAALVRGETLVAVAKKIDLGSYIKMTKGEESCGGRHNESNLENALEALIGAIYLDGSIESLKVFINKWWADLLDVMREPPRDPKTQLQELVQGQGLPIPEYQMMSNEGPAHSPVFEIKLCVNGFGEVVASDNSKKKAQKKAAKMMLNKILDEND